MSHKKDFSVSPIAAAVSAALAAPGAALAQDDGATARLDEIIVTARKREENLQKIPASIHALPEAMLKEIGAMNTEDYVRYMPSVNWVNFNSGGSNFVIFRGVNTTSSGFTGTQSSSVYLDEIPLTATDGTQPDIRMMDINRAEALSGPQGTLFGAAAQAGTLRIITNKPDTSRFEASGEAMFRSGDTSDPSHSITGMINIPLVEDVFAIRIAAQTAEDGGYIDNVLGHTPDTWWGETAAESAANAPPAYGLPGHLPPNYTWRCEQGQGDCVWGTHRLEWGNYQNDDVAEENWNSAEFTNVRVSARWEINENWSATFAYHYGETDSQGSSAYNPYVGDLQTIGFAKNTSNSEWDVSALTIEADLGFAQFVSATSFFENQRTYQIDNTLYYKYYTTNYCGDQGAVGATYYTWYYWENPATDRAVYLPLYCVTPAANPSGDLTQIPDMAGVGEGPEWQERFSQEFRLSHQGETFDWLGGLYYEESNDSWNSVWMKDANTPYQDSMSYAFIEACVNGTVANYGCTTGYGGNPIDAADPAEVTAALANADHYWDSRDDTDWEQKAVFGEVTWHATDDLNVTVGGRWFETTNDKLYIKYLAGHKGSDDRNTGGFVQPIWQGNDITQTISHSKFVPKLSLAYTLDEDKMVYGTYTEGYRVGGINRANRRADWTRTIWGQAWEPDKLMNYEMGLKSRWADNTLQLNLTYFYMDWEDFQHEVVDPSVGECIDVTATPPCAAADSLPWISIVGNVGDAHSTGVTAEIDWVPADGWHLGGNAQFLQAEIDSTTSGPEAGIAKGQQLPNVPEFQGAAWAMYTWPVSFVGGGEMYLRGQVAYTGETTTKLVPAGEDTGNPSFTNASYALADLRFGLNSSEGNWQIDVFVNNITDERAQIQQGTTHAWQWGRTNEYERWHSVYTVRPREYGIRFNARWGD